MPKGNRMHIMPRGSLIHLLPPALRLALGLQAVADVSSNAPEGMNDWEEEECEWHWYQC